MMREGIGARLAVAACVALMTGVLASCSDDSSSPAITGAPAKIATVGQAYRFQPRAVNVSKGRSLRFTIANKPSWASFDAASGELSGTPTEHQVGLFPAIQIGLTAGTVRASLPAFSITVVPPASAAANAATDAVTIFWQAPTDNTDGSFLTNLSGYKIYYGGASGEYSSSIDIPNPGLTSYVVQDLRPGHYYFAVTAYTSAGVESGFSSEVSAALD
jgi:hypothetical protein